MRRILIITITAVSLLFIGCNPKSTSNIKERSNTKENIDYQVDDITLSKSYQNIEPNVEIITKDRNLKLLLSLGLVESSGVNITQINKVNNEIDIYVENKNQTDISEIVTPQVLIALENIKSRDIKDFKFNIINKNYEPLDIKFGINEVLDKINADFNLLIDGFPNVNIINKSNRILWDININNTFDRYNIENPIINLSVLVDANTGEVIDSSKTLISSLVDEGKILNYISNNYILYKKTKEDSENNISNCDLWLFNIENNNKEIIYQSKDEIKSAIPNPKFNQIGVLEHNEENNDIYIVETDTNKPYKAPLNKNINPKIIRWKNNEDLYIIDSKEKSSNIYLYNIRDNSYKLFSKVNKNIVDLNIFDDYLIITEKEIDSENLKIHLTKDFNEDIFSDYGFQPSFINNYIVYLKPDQDDSFNQLLVYNLKEDELYDSIDMDISNYTLLNDGNIALIEKNDSDNGYGFHRYSLEEKSQEFVSNINSSHMFYNSDKNLLYMDYIIPFESHKSEIIYSLDLGKLED